MSCGDSMWSFTYVTSRDQLALYISRLIAVGHSNCRHATRKANVHGPIGCITHVINMSSGNKYIATVAHNMRCLSYRLAGICMYVCERDDEGGGGTSLQQGSGKN